MFNQLLNLIFPKYCVYCYRPGNYLCPKCKTLLDFIPLPIELNMERIYLDSLQATFFYHEPIISLIKELKYKNVLGIAKYLALLIYLTTDYPPVDLITYVPTTLQKYRMRGYNQAAEIAKEFSRLTNKSCLPLLVKTKNVTNQASLNYIEQRKNNLKNTIKLNNNINTNLYKNKKILIMDDVITTGSTINHCAQVIKDKLNSTTYGLCVAARIV